MTFEEDLTKRRIDVTAFAAGDPERYAAWRSLYQHVHPNTFYTSVKMVINDVRRQFWLPEAPKPVATATAPAAAKPVIRRVTGTIPSTASAIPDEPSPSVDRTPEPALAPRARAVIRRPVAESEANASPEGKNKTENIAAAAPDTTNTPIEPPKPARPRPVFRKPGTPVTNAATGEEIKNIPAEAATTSIPEHSNPDPTEAPKPPRPRPVFKRPTTAATEPEETTASPENTLIALSQPETTEEKPPEVATAVPKPPRPRPIVKRPTAASTTSEPEQKVEEVQPEIAPEPTADKPKFPRPRPVIKRPASATESQTPEFPAANIPVTEDAAPVSAEPENNNPEQPTSVAIATNEVTPTTAEVKPEPEVSKTPRPRPIFKKPTKSEPNTGTPENKPDTE